MLLLPHMSLLSSLSLMSQCLMAHSFHSLQIPKLLPPCLLLSKFPFHLHLFVFLSLFSFEKLQPPNSIYSSFGSALPISHQFPVCSVQYPRFCPCSFPNILCSPSTSLVLFANYMLSSIMSVHQQIGESLSIKLALHVPFCPCPRYPI